jgi:hypothetical protein
MAAPRARRSGSLGSPSSRWSPDRASAGLAAAVPCLQRPRKHPSDADRSAAYREQRERLTKRVDRKTVEALVAAVEAAAAAGDPIARQLKTDTVDHLLKELAACFERRASGMGR